MKHYTLFIKGFIIFCFANFLTVSLYGNDNRHKMTEEQEAEWLSRVEFIEDFEKDIDLGFDTTLYLPLHFNPYKGMVFTLDEIDYIDLDE